MFLVTFEIVILDNPPYSEDDPCDFSVIFTTKSLVSDWDFKGLIVGTQNGAGHAQAL